jgi:hypothetical protein
MYAKHKSGNSRNICCLYWPDVQVVIHYSKVVKSP